MNKLCLVPLLAASICGLSAAENLPVGPRAHGMAGANVASVNDATAQYYNPGALGFFRQNLVMEDADDIDETDEELDVSSNDNHRLSERDFDLSIDAGVGYRLTGEIGNYLDRLSKIDVNSFNNVNQANGINAQQLDDLVSTLGILGTVAAPDNNIIIQTTAGMNMRIKNFAVGVRGFGTFVARVNTVDRGNLGLDFSDVTTFSTALETIGATLVPGNDLNAYTNQYLGDALVTDLEAALDNDNDPLTSPTTTVTNAIKTLDYQIGISIQNGLLDANDVAAAVELLESVAAQIDLDPSNGLDANATSILISGVGIVEIPVSYGHAFNDNWSIGVSGKLMIGRHYGAVINVFDDDNVDNAVETLTDDFHESQAFGIDIGIMGRANNFQFGLTGRNLNSPTFEGFTTVGGYTFTDITLDPAITIGVAWIPSNSMTLEVDIDITPTEAGASQYETQNLAVGAEWILLNFLALRAGSYINLAEDEIGLVYTGGIGLNLALINIDLAASYSPETVALDGDDVPEEASVSLGIAARF